MSIVFVTFNVNSVPAMDYTFCPFFSSQIGPSSLWFFFWLINVIESQKQRMGQVGREHSRSLVQPPCSSRIIPEHNAQDCSWRFLNISSERDFTISLGNLFQCERYESSLIREMFMVDEDEMDESFSYILLWAQAIRNTTTPKNAVFCFSTRVESMWTQHLEELDFGSKGSNSSFCSLEI